MKAELLQYSWEDLAGALLVKSKDAKVYTDDELGHHSFCCFDKYLPKGFVKTTRHSIQSILDKVKEIDEFVRDNCDMDKEVETGLPFVSMPMFAQWRDLIHKLEIEIERNKNIIGGEK